jgi:hypothetical protein
MLSRRRFLAHTSLIAGSTALADALFAKAVAGTELGPSPDPKLLERAKSLLEHAPLIDTRRTGRRYSRRNRLGAQRAHCNRNTARCTRAQHRRHAITRERLGELTGHLDCRWEDAYA